jgi:hypothetical protein
MLLVAILLAAIGLVGEHLGLETIMFSVALLTFLGYLWLTRIIRCSYRAARRQWRHAHIQISRANPINCTPGRMAPTPCRSPPSQP